MYKCFDEHAKRHTSKYKYGVKAPCNTNKPLHLIKNGKILCQDKIGRYMNHIKGLKTSIPLKRCAKDTENYTFVTVHMWFEIYF